MPIIGNHWLSLCLLLTAFNFVSPAPTDKSSPINPKEPSNEPPNITDAGTGHYHVVTGRRGPQLTQFQSQPELGTNSRNGNEVPAIPNPDELIYTMPALVGDQQLMLQLDTGSADLYVVLFRVTLLSGILLTGALFSYVLGPDISSEKVEGRTVFKSRLFRELPDVEFRLEYQGGDWATGKSGLSQVGVGGVVLPNEMINVAKDVRNPQLADGLIGMSIGRLLAGTKAPYRYRNEAVWSSYRNTEGQTPQPNQFLENLMHSLDRPIFAANLRAGAPSSYQFGFFNREKFKKGQNAIVRVDPSQGQWQFESPGVIVGKQRILGPMPSLVGKYYRTRTRTH